MKNRNIVALLLLTIVTFGFYYVYWAASTRGEMNRRGATIPTTWLIIIPFVNIWWLWKHSEGVEHVTNSKISAVVAFLLQFFVGVIGAMVIQNEFNKIGDDTQGAANEPQQPQPAAQPIEAVQAAAAPAQTPPTEPPVPPTPTIPTI